MSNSPNEQLPALIFIHGAWHGAWCWEEHFLPFFAESGYECYAFDLPNHGHSKHQKGINNHRISDYVNNLKTVLAKINKPHILVGHSMGGYIVQKYLEKNDCEGVILLASVPGKPIWRFFLKMTLDYPLSMIQSFLRMDLSGVINTPDKSRKYLYSKDIPQEKLEKYTALLSSESLSVILFDFLFAKLKARKNSHYPILVQSVGKDAIISPEENKYTATFQKADYQEIKELAHNVMLESEWELSANGMLNWLKEKFPTNRIANKAESPPLKNRASKIDFPDAVPNLITNLGKKIEIDADKTKILGLGKSKRNN